MEFARTELGGVVLIRPQVFRDARGFFVETWRRDRFKEAGIDVDFVQDNHSSSVKDVIRALHFQTYPGQAKLVSVPRGRVFDVTVDLRRASPTFGRWQGVILDDQKCEMLFVPVGFAHGFAVLSDHADVCYRVSSVYDPSTERGLAWDDPTLAIRWPVDHPLLSDRDRQNPPFAAQKDSLPDWR